LYLDQDSSGQDDYSDDDDDYQAHSSLLTSLGPPSSSPNTHHTQPNHNPWPSSFSNGRFSRHSTLTGKRKSNPFRGFTASPDQEEEDERRSSSEGGERDMKPYRDDDSDYEHNTHEREEDNALNNPTAIHAQTHHAPYRMFTLPQPFSQHQHSTTDGKRTRSPRNPQGKMAWFDGEEEDAEEVIDVDALIAEQVKMPIFFFSLSLFLCCSVVIPFFFCKSKWAVGPHTPAYPIYPISHQTHVYEYMQKEKDEGKKKRATVDRTEFALTCKYVVVHAWQFD